MDVAEAYDKVWKARLLYKMVILKFPGWIIRLVRSWMEQRSFGVRSGIYLSAPRIAEEGLPQGSALSPLLFNIFVYDIPTFARDRFVHLLQFADDTAIIASGRNFESAKIKVEKALQLVVKYTTKWRISLNRDKTEAILFGRKKNRISIC